MPLIKLELLGIQFGISAFTCNLGNGFAFVLTVHRVVLMRKRVLKSVLRSRDTTLVLLSMIL